MSTYGKTVVARVAIVKCERKNADVTATQIPLLALDLSCVIIYKKQKDQNLFARNENAIVARCQALAETEETGKFPLV